MKKESDIKESAVSKPVSLAPLTFEEAVKGMLVIPAPKQKEKKTQKKPAKKR